MLLTVDIGNTSITMGIFDNNKLKNTYRMESNKHLTIKEYAVLIKQALNNTVIDSCIIASVVPGLDTVFKVAVDSVYKLNSVILTNKSYTGTKLKLKDNNEAGTDRIANACAAVRLYKLPAIVIDSGTATTFDIVNANGEFIGGVIAPGLRVQLYALNKCTSQLPKIDIDRSHSVIGNNTEEAILSGVIRGTACMIEGLIFECEKELGHKATIIATGGYCNLIADYMNRKFDYINPSLTIEGLKYLYELNLKPVH